MDAELPRTRLEQLIQASKRTISEHCVDFEATARQHRESATMSYRQLSRWKRGDVTGARVSAQRVAELHWGEPFEVLVGPPLEVPAAPPPSPLPAEVADAVDQVRDAVHASVTSGSRSPAALDDWDLTVQRHGRATRYIPAGVLLGELAADVAALQRALDGGHTVSSLRRITRVTAQLAGLLFLTLIKLNRPSSARSWARTARVAADEAGDPTVKSWVAAQEAYVYYYAGNLAEAVEVARRAQHLAGGTACVGVPLAAALEARAQGAMRQRSAALAAIERAEVSLDQLDDTSVARSAFGYDEAQLRFHVGNALTHLHDSDAARQAQRRALELYPANDFLDRALVQLDEADCLVLDDDVPAAMDRATAVLVALQPEEREGLVLVRARELADGLAPRQGTAHAVHEFRELLASLAGPATP